jgi:hypothetical protein
LYVTYACNFTAMPQFSKPMPVFRMRRVIPGVYRDGGKR